MFIIGEVTIEEPVSYERFSCDVARCKGACCTLPGGKGAPLEDDELLEIERALPAAQKYLSTEHRGVIDARGWFESDGGKYVTTCVDDRACVFAYSEAGITRCSLEKAYVSGETSWRKPLSCHLFPIRIDRNGADRLRYEEIPDCSVGVSKGRREKTMLYDFLKDPLIMAYGVRWYNEFRAECIRRDTAARTNNNRTESNLS